MTEQKVKDIDWNALAASNPNRFVEILIAKLKTVEAKKQN